MVFVQAVLEFIDLFRDLLDQFFGIAELPFHKT